MQTKALIAAALLAVWSAFLSYLVWHAALSHAAGRERDLMAKQLDKVLDEQEQDRKRAEKLQKTLDRLPKSEGKVRDAVRGSPSNCERPKPVADAVRKAVEAANAARGLQDLHEVP